MMLGLGAWGRPLKNGGQSWEQGRCSPPPCLSPPEATEGADPEVMGAGELALPSKTAALGRADPVP